MDITAAISQIAQQIMELNEGESSACSVMMDRRLYDALRLDFKERTGVHPIALMTFLGVPVVVKDDMEPWEWWVVAIEAVE